MVCQDCEKKLTKVIVPDKWKDGARNVSDDGGRATTYKNSLLQVRGSTQRYTAGVNSCKICKSKVAQEAHYCQECAHQNGICAMCGKRVEDLRFDNRGKVQNLKFKKSLEARKEDAEKPDRDKGDEGGYGTAERFAKKQKMDDDAENAELPPIEELSEEAQKAIDDAAAAAVAQEAYSSALEMASTRVAQNHGRSRGPASTFAIRAPRLTIRRAGSKASPTAPPSRPTPTPAGPLRSTPAAAARTTSTRRRASRPGSGPRTSKRPRSLSTRTSNRRKSSMAPKPASSSPCAKKGSATTATSRQLSPPRRETPAGSNAVPSSRKVRGTAGREGCRTSRLWKSCYTRASRVAARGRRSPGATTCCGRPA